MLVCESVRGIGDVVPRMEKEEEELEKVCEKTCRNSASRER